MHVKSQKTSTLKVTTVTEGWMVAIHILFCTMSPVICQMCMCYGYITLLILLGKQREHLIAKNKLLRGIILAQ